MTVEKIIVGKDLDNLRDVNNTPGCVNRERSYDPHLTVWTGISFIQRRKFQDGWLIYRFKLSVPRCYKHN